MIKQLNKQGTKILFLGLAGFVLIFSMNRCYWDNEEYLYPNLANCDTTVFTFSGAVKPIISASCLSCHGTSVAASYGNNIKLETYSDLKIQVDNGKLIGTITHSSGFSAMPKGAGKIDDCKITIIKKWVTANALNN